MSQVLSEKVRSQFNKTALCKFHLRRKCRKGQECTFAHDTSELCTAPDLTKTSLCQAWKEGRCPLPSDACCFAHGLHDLHMTAAFSEEVEACDAKSNQQESVHQFYETTKLPQAGNIESLPPDLVSLFKCDAKSNQQESFFQFYETTKLPQAGNIESLPPDLVSLFKRWPREFISIADMGNALMQFVNTPCIDKDPDVLRKIEMTLLCAAPTGYED